jgi:hypothetical protein
VLLGESSFCCLGEERVRVRRQVGKCNLQEKKWLGELKLK